MSTPMFEQFHALKAENPGAILLFRMGDFYETFFEDAEVAARVLGLTLTSRNKADPEPVPMAGVPYHALSTYVQRLTDAGYRVAIAEQTEDPALAKGLVKREIVRIVSPGLVLDPETLDLAQSCWLSAIHVQRGGVYGLAILDVTTGAFRQCNELGREDLLGELARLEPREFLLSPKLSPADVDAITAIAQGLGASLGEPAPAAFSTTACLQELREVLGVADLAGFGVREEAPGAVAAGAVLICARHALRTPLRNVHTLRTWTLGHAMVVDASTRRNLELFRTLMGERKEGSLVGLIDHTVTAMGARTLRDWLAAPLMDLEAIGARHDAVQHLVEDFESREALRSRLSQVRDLERLGARIAQQTATPRDLASLRESLAHGPEIARILQNHPFLAALLPDDLLADVHAQLAHWIVDDPPLVWNAGGMIRPEADPELAELIDLGVDGHAVVARMEERERIATGISTLKIRQNRVFGYYLEVSRSQLHRVPERFVRRQTLAGAERFITPELKELEDRVLGAQERRASLEMAHFLEIRTQMLGVLTRLGVLARALASLDVIANLAEIAQTWGWVRPRMVAQPVLELEQVRHPVVEASLEPGQFVPNDINLDPVSRRLIILTGPNMAGKSTVLRQTAILVLLAQIGSFVPASRAVVGLCDRICTRVGAADDLASGRSTFMVEMSETAAILHHATAQSLVILDEIGRGTSTYDGLAIAWAVAEDMVDRIGCRALFATHYHELCELAQSRKAVANQSVAVRTSGDRILFLRKLVEGGANRSYGVACARLAGLPHAVVTRARALMLQFETHGLARERPQMDLFVPTPELASPPSAGLKKLESLKQELSALDVDGMTPREALAELARLKDAWV